MAYSSVWLLMDLPSDNWFCCLILKWYWSTYKILITVSSPSWGRRTHIFQGQQLKRFCWPKAWFPCGVHCLFFRFHFVYTTEAPCCIKTRGLPTHRHPGMLSELTKSVKIKWMFLKHVKDLCGCPSFRHKMALFFFSLIPAKGIKLKWT